MHWIALQPRPEPPRPEGDAPPLNGEAPALADALTALGWWALQFTPKVARLEAVLLLEVSASERLWGGAQPLLRQMRESSQSVAPLHYARGATSLVALARLQAPGLARTLPDDLPLAALAAARPHLATLERIGCSYWGQLRALPRAGVVRRFGAPLLGALDRAYGLQPELYPWLVLPAFFQATLELAAQVETASALLFGARRLLGSLQVWLQLRQCGVLALELGWTMDARRDTATQGQLVLRTAEPSADMVHLQRLLGEHLARVSLPAPVLYLHLRTLETCKLEGRSASLLPDDLRRGESLPQLLERLSARLGPKQVVQMQACADHRPERMQAWQPASGALFAAVASGTKGRGTHGKNPQPEIQKDALYPTWLLATPLPLTLRGDHPLYQGPLTLLAGPQRLEAGWWEGDDCALRDYFLARNAQSDLLWIYRDRLTGQGLGGKEKGHGASGAASEPHWYLHGFFG